MKKILFFVILSIIISNSIWFWYVKNVRACYFAKGVISLHVVDVNGKLNIFKPTEGDHRACKVILEKR